MNTVNLVGRITQDPQTRFMPDGDSVVNFNLAYNDGGYEGFVNDLEWWNPNGAAQFLTVGKRVAITGTLRTRNHRTRVVVRSLELLDGGQPRQGSVDERPAGALAMPDEHSTGELDLSQIPF